MVLFQEGRGRVPSFPMRRSDILPRRDFTVHVKRTWFAEDSVTANE